MAKSIRSKLKRSFRAKKRTEGIYAATEAARLHRLNSKIREKITSQAPEDTDDQSPHGDPADELAGEEQIGPYWFELLGLLGHDQLDPERMHALDMLIRVCERRGGMRRVVVVNVEEGQFFPDL
jgi:hypothetical protein